MKRAMTEAERGQLLAMTAARRDRPPGEAWGALVFALEFGPAVYGGLALGLLTLGAALFGLPLRDGAWRENALTFYGTLVVVGGVWLGLVASGIRWLRANGRSRAADVALMAADLEKAIVLDEAQAVLGVKRLREPEHGMILLFLLLGSGKVFVLYDHDAGLEGSLPLTPLSQLHLATFPASKRRVWSFSGEPLPLAEPGRMDLEPEHWPEDEAWCRVKWENIERHFAVG